MIDPEIKAETGQQRKVLAAIKTRGLNLHRLPSGALRLVGREVHVTVAALGMLTLADLTAPSPAELRVRAMQLREAEGRDRARRG